LYRYFSNGSQCHPEINLGRVLGTGGFSVVTEVKSVDLDEIYDVDAKSTQLRAKFASSARNVGSIKYVLKTLRNDLIDEDHEKGVTDLAVEAEFLQLLLHPNIVSMRAVSQSDPRRSRYFVILDYLPTTLDLKLNLWRRLVGENTGYWIPCYGYCCSKDIVLHINWKERLHSAADIASGKPFVRKSARCAVVATFTILISYLFSFSICMSTPFRCRHRVSTAISPSTEYRL
jgi:hypothetical protein